MCCVVSVGSPSYGYTFDQTGLEWYKKCAAAVYLVILDFDYLNLQNVVHTNLIYNVAWLFDACPDYQGF